MAQGISRGEERMGMETFWKLLLELSSIIFVKFDRRKYINKACSAKNNIYKEQRETNELCQINNNLGRSMPQKEFNILCGFFLTKEMLISLIC